MALFPRIAAMPQLIVGQANANGSFTPSWKLPLPDWWAGRVDLSSERSARPSASPLKSTAFPNLIVNGITDESNEDASLKLMHTPKVCMNRGELERLSCKTKSTSFSAQLA
jgi:hypothetical protein